MITVRRVSHGRIPPSATSGFHHVTGDSEANTDVAAVRRQNRGVNTVSSPFPGSPARRRVTAVNRGVGLNKVLVIFLRSGRYA